MAHTKRAGRHPEVIKTHTPNTHTLFSFSVLAVVLATLILQTGCIGITGANGGTNPPASTTAPQINVNPPSLSFGSLPIGSSGTSTVTISNPGTATLTISQATISGAAFSIVSGASVISIPPGQSQTITIKFTPASAGSVTGSVTLTSNVTGSPLNIPLSGAGLSAGSPGITTVPTSLNLGPIVIGSPYAQAITIQNPGSSTLTITQATVSGTGFSITGLPLPMTLPAGTNNTFNAVFAPTSTATVSGSITLTSNAPSGPYVIALSGSGAQGLLAINPSPVNFGSVTVGGNSSQTITFSNSGAGSTTVSQITASGSGFSFSGIQVPFTLAGGQNTSFTAKFTPSTVGAASGSISVVSSAPNSPSTVTLNGTGIQPGISANPSSENFGNVTVGSPSSQTMQISNTGSSSLTITQANVAGTGFSLNGLTLPLTIPTGASTTFNVVFAPASGGSVSGSISVVSNAPNSPLAIPLSGTGVQAGISASPSSMAFGNVTVGSSSSQTIQLSNSGSSSLTITQANVAGTGYSLNGLALPATIAAGANTSFNVVFAPTAAGSSSGSISIVSNAPNSPLSIPLSGTGIQAGISATPSTVAFGSVIVGSPNSQTIRLSNTGSSSLTITQANIAGTGFSLNGLALPASIPTGGSTTFNVVFGPASAGSVSGSISVVSNAPNSPLAIPLSGTGVATTLLLGASTSNLSFGNVAVGSNSAQNVTITNSGNSTVTVSGLTITGAGFAGTGVSTGQAIAAGQTAILRVTFTPGSAVTVSGTATISSNATNSPVTISLSGTGTQTPTAHSVTLTWTASTSSVVGYNVYRGTVSGGPYTLITSSPVAGTTFTDTTVQAGLTYFYVVTAVDASGNESVFSNEATATIPIP